MDAHTAGDHSAGHIQSLTLAIIVMIMGSQVCRIRLTADLGGRKLKVLGYMLSRMRQLALDSDPVCGP